MGRKNDVLSVNETWPVHWTSRYERLCLGTSFFVSLSRKRFKTINSFSDVNRTSQSGSLHCSERFQVVQAGCLHMICAY
jgi:hypothetical protein